MEKESAKRRGAPWSRGGQRAGVLGTLETGPAESGGSKFMVTPSTSLHRTLTSFTLLGALHRQTVDPGSAHHGSCSLPPAGPVKTWISRSLPNVINRTGGVALSGRSHRNWRRPLRLRQRWDHDGVSKHRQPGTLPVACMRHAMLPLCAHSQTDRNVVAHKAQRVTRYSRSNPPGETTWSVSGAPSVSSPQIAHPTYGVF